MTKMENCALNGVNVFLFHLPLVVEHAHNFVDIGDLVARIRMTVQIDMFPLGHVLFILNWAICQ